MAIFHDVMGIRNIAYEELMWRTVYPEYEKRNAAGVTVNERNATSVADYFKCVHVISEDIAKLPKKVMRRATVAGRETREPAPTHPLYWLLHAEPNPQMSSFRYFETGVIHLLTWGNWYTYIQRAPMSGRVQALWPLCPHLVRIEPRRATDPDTVRYWYMVVNPSTNREERFYPDEILHVPFFSYDGIQGQSPVRLLMDTLGVAKAEERYAARFFANSARISGLVSPETGVTMSPEQRQQLEESLQKYVSADNAGRLAVVQGHVKWQTISMPNNEAQFLESRKFSRVDIAGILRIAPHKISDLENAHFTNIEHSEIGHVKDALQPSVERIEQEFERALLPEWDKGKVFIHCELDGQMRGDTAARTAYFREMFNTSSMSPNEIREKENLPPYVGGDERWVQLNMVPVSLAKELLTMKSQPPEPQQPAPPQKQDEPNPDNVQSVITRELQARVQRGYLRVFRDAVNRTVRRSRADRERFAPSAFIEIMNGLAEMLGSERDSDFLKDYVGALAKRSAEWESAETEMIARQELDRAVAALLQEGFRK